MAMLSSVADQGLKLATGTGRAMADQGLKLAMGTGKAAWSAGATCMSAADTARQVVPGMAWKLARSTGKAVWIAGTTAIVLGLPLLIVLERDAQLTDVYNQEAAQAVLLGTGHA